MSVDHTTLRELARELAQLHHGDLLVLPNAWDAATARAVERGGFRAVATTSAAISEVLGWPDGEQTPVDEMFAATARIARAVQVPVTMDAESGYGLAATELVDRLLDAGVVGCNLEDTDHRRGGLKSAEEHAAWLTEVRSAADGTGVPLVINARVDVFLPASGVPDQDRLEEAVRRGRRYRAAGADCVYPIGIGDVAVLAELVTRVEGPVNGNAGPALTLARLRELGVARVSYGPRFHRVGLAAFETAIAGLEVSA